MIVSFCRLSWEMPDLVISFSQSQKQALEFSSLMNLPLVILKREEDFQKIEKGKILLVLDQGEKEKEIKKALSYLYKIESIKVYLLSLFRK